MAIRVEDLQDSRHRAEIAGAIARNDPDMLVANGDQRHRLESSGFIRTSPSGYSAKSSSGVSAGVRIGCSRGDGARESIGPVFGDWLGLWSESARRTKNYLSYLANKFDWTELQPGRKSPPRR